MGTKLESKMMELRKKQRALIKKRNQAKDHIKYKKYQSEILKIETKINRL